MLNGQTVKKKQKNNPPPTLFWVLVHIHLGIQSAYLPANSERRQPNHCVLGCLFQETHFNKHFRFGSPCYVTSISTHGLRKMGKVIDVYQGKCYLIGCWKRTGGVIRQGEKSVWCFFLLLKYIIDILLRLHWTVNLWNGLKCHL